MAAPRWKLIIENAIATHSKQTVIQVATLGTDARDGQLMPRVRCQIFRSFLCSPDDPSLPVLLSSTDVRTPKVSQLISNSSKSEVVWWIEGTRQQFRFIADVYVVPERQNRILHDRFEKALRGASRESGLGSLRDEDWENRRVEMFRSMSAEMKASWCRPRAPGTKLEGGQEEAKTWPEEIFEPDERTMDSEAYRRANGLWTMALQNFGLIVVDPIEVDFLDLNAMPNVRSLFRKSIGDDDDDDDEGSVKWIEEELVP